MAFPKLTATEEMKQIAASDMPRKEKTKYGYVTEVCDYYVYLRCVVQAGILKAALFFPDYLRLLDLLHEGLQKPYSKFVCSRIIVTVFREVAFGCGAGLRCGHLLPGGEQTAV